MKRKHHVKKTTLLIEQISAMIVKKTQSKYKDPGCPIIICHIRASFARFGSKCKLHALFSLLAPWDWRDQIHICGTTVG